MAIADIAAYGELIVNGHLVERQNLKEVQAGPPDPAADERQIGELSDAPASPAGRREQGQQQTGVAAAREARHGAPISSDAVGYCSNIWVTTFRIVAWSASGSASIG